jgi:hypothetical protein
MLIRFPPNRSIPRSEGFHSPKARAGHFSSTASISNQKTPPLMPRSHDKAVGVREGLTGFVERTSRQLLLHCPTFGHPCPRLCIQRTGARPATAPALLYLRASMPSPARPPEGLSASPSPRQKGVKIKSTVKSASSGLDLSQTSASFRRTTEALPLRIGR